VTPCPSLTQFHHIGLYYTFYFHWRSDSCPLFAFKRCQPDILSGVRDSLPVTHPISPHRLILLFKFGSIKTPPTASSQH